VGLFRYTTRTFARELLLLALAAIWWIPFYFLVVVSLKSDSEVYTQSAGAFPKRLVWGNYSTAWRGTGGASLGAALRSSLVITAGSVLALVAIGSITAYAIARHRGKLGTLLYFTFVLGIIVPFQLGLIPTFVVLRHLHLTTSYFGMILLYTGILMPLSVFLFTGFVRTLPRDYEEAAYIDGASRLLTFSRVVFPLLRPIAATVAVLAAVLIWNDFFIQLVFLAGSANQTVVVAIYSFVGEYATNWNLVFATVIMSIAPILVFYVFAQRRLVRGFTGGIKT
jgi:raffinose/stachyose/melibiose transport system permease protein